MYTDYNNMYSNNYNFNIINDQNWCNSYNLYEPVSPTYQLFDSNSASLFGLTYEDNHDADLLSTQLGLPTYDSPMRTNLSSPRIDIDELKELILDGNRTDFNPNNCNDNGLKMTTNQVRDIPDDISCKLDLIGSTRSISNDRFFFDQNDDNHFDEEAQLNNILFDDSFLQNLNNQISMNTINSMIAMNGVNRIDETNIDSFIKIEGRTNQYNQTDNNKNTENNLLSSFSTNYKEINNSVMDNIQIKPDLNISESNILESNTLELNSFESNSMESNTQESTESKKKRIMKTNYDCRLCGQPRKYHICPFKSRKESNKQLSDRIRRECTTERQRKRVTRTRNNAPLRKYTCGKCGHYKKDGSGKPHICLVDSGGTEPDGLAI